MNVVQVALRLRVLSGLLSLNRKHQAYPPVSKAFVTLRLTNEKSEALFLLNTFTLVLIR